jgi:RecA/RadA recombinase
MRRRKQPKGEGSGVPKVMPPLSIDTPKGLLKVVKEWKAWKPAAQVLVNVRAVPTCFLGLDHALRVGGFPLGRMYVTHGPTGGGKSSFVLGLVRSFLQRGNLAAYVDAEHTTPISWVRDMVAQHADHPLFLAKRPTTYQETVDAVDEILEGLKEAREEKPDLATLIVIDSINKLTPDREMETMMKQGADAMDKGWGRVRAQMNQAWVDHLTPLLAERDVAVLFIAQERTKQNATPDDVRYGSDWEIKGGKGILYDSSLILRVLRASWIKEGEAEKARVLGTRHRVRVHKSKVEWLGKQEDFYFHVTNGKDGNPAGFDFDRDLLELGLALGVLERSGGWIRWEAGDEKWNGEGRFLSWAHETPSDALDAAVRAAMKFSDAEVEG